MNEWQIRIVDPGYKFTREIYIFRRLQNGNAEFLGVGETIEIPAGSAIKPKPSIELDPEQLQAFSDALNANGFKPQDGFTEGKLEATERHLLDMRKLLKLS